MVAGAGGRANSPNRYMPPRQLSQTTPSRGGVPRRRRLVAASERYLEVSRMQLDRNAPKVMRKAQVDAVRTITDTGSATPIA